MQTTAEAIELSPIETLTRDLRKAALTLEDREARYLVDSYYMMQHYRIVADNHHRSLQKDGEPNQVVGWISTQARTLENQVRYVLGVYADQSRLGRWARSNVGIGPVLAAGLLAYIDQGVPTVGHVFSYAGLTPEKVHRKRGEKALWNPSLRTLCWKIGESFVKQKGRDEGHYGRFYDEAKIRLWQKNLRGEYAEAAAASIARSPKLKKDTITYKFYSGQLSPTEVGKILGLGGAISQEMKATDEGDETPMLPPAHIHARARRITVKLFLSHWFEVACTINGRTAAVPYVIAHLGHVDYIPPFVSLEGVS